jgi:hypothetical protein
LVQQSNQTRLNQADRCQNRDNQGTRTYVDEDYAAASTYDLFPGSVLRMTKSKVRFGETPETNARDGRATHPEPDAA